MLIYIKLCTHIGRIDRWRSRQDTTDAAVESVHLRPPFEDKALQHVTYTQPI
jgi:hypothetical protein